MASSKKHVGYLTLTFLCSFDRLKISNFIPSGVVRGVALPVVATFLALLKKVVILFSLGVGFKEDIKDTAMASKIADATFNIRKSLAV